jgi:hypothetical protein
MGRKGARMGIDLEHGKREFGRLVEEAFGSDELLGLLLSLHRGDSLSADDAGWVLWNICDWYALAGDPVSEHRYQSELFELVKGSFPERAHWVVCDSTQAGALIEGGFSEFWSECSQFANDTAPRSAGNRGARFEAHRANAAQYTCFGQIDRGRAALEALAALLEEDREWPGWEFANATHKTILVQFHGATGQAAKVEETAEDLAREVLAWHARVGDAEVATRAERPLFGSWRFFVADWPADARLPVAMVNAACELAGAEQFVAAERLFRPHWHGGRGLNAWCAADYLLTCWRNRHDGEEVRRLLQESESLTAERLAELAPELAEVVRG